MKLVFAINGVLLSQEEEHMAKCFQLLLPPANRVNRRAAAATLRCTRAMRASRCASVAAAAAATCVFGSHLQQMTTTTVVRPLEAILK